MTNIRNIKFSDINSSSLSSLHEKRVGDIIRGSMRAERSRKDVNEIREADAGSIRDNNEEDFYNEDRRSSLGGAAEASLAFANRKRHVVAHLSYPRCVSPLRRRRRT